MLKVYYATKIWDGQKIIILTDKPFWDENHYADDGGSPHYAAITKAMYKAGVEELSEATYEMPATGIKPIIQSMREQGYELVKNAEFTHFIKTHD